MQQRTIDAPDHEWVTTEQACAFLGIGETLLEAEADRYAEWLRPRLFGEGKRKVKKWYWLDLICLSNILRNRRELPEDSA